MSGDPDEAEHRVNPFDRGEAIARKRARQTQLARALCGPTPAADADGDLDTLADAVAGRVLERLTEDAPAPTDPLTAAALDKLARKQALADVLRGRPAAPAEPEARPASGFDGGARASVPGPPESHEQWLYDRIIDARSHRGAHW